MSFIRSVTMTYDLHENILNWIKFIFWHILSSSTFFLIVHQLLQIP